MNTLTIRLPDDTADRVRALARRRGLSVNKLFEELTTQALVESDTEMRFRALATQADPARALQILDRLDRLDAASQPDKR